MVITAKKSGTCVDCGQSITEGETARWFPKIGLLCLKSCRRSGNVVALPGVNLDNPHPAVTPARTESTPKTAAFNLEITDTSRDVVIKRIKSALRIRSGKEWSVSGGKGTAYGWIKIRAIKKHAADGYSNLTEADQKYLAQLLGLEKPVHFQGESIPASTAYYTEYIDRAEGRKPRKCGTPYWD